EELAASTTLLTSDAQKIHQNLMAYVNDLRCQDVTFQTLPKFKGNWEMQVKSVCAEIMKIPSDPVKQLYNYYQLGVVLETQDWSKRARKEIQIHFPI
ncbi:5526_t:CDS:1, partial [Gigaspora rosea]